jgi:hypothetical protein
MSNTILKPRGVLWRDLSNAEKQEIREQIKNIEHDPSYSDYKYYRTQFNKWIICNIWTVPMKTAKVIFNG